MSGDETPGSFDPDNGNAGVCHCQVCVRILTGLPSKFLRCRVVQSVVFSLEYPPEPPPMAESPVPDQFARGSTLPAATVSMDDFDNPECRRIPHGLPRVEKGAFNLLRTPARVCDVDRQEHRAHRTNRRRRSEFVTTLTELSAMAPAATTGVSRPNAASGIAMTL